MADLKMPELNYVLIVGNLTKDPVFRRTSNNTPVVNFSIASNRRYKDRSNTWQEDVCYIGIVAWNKLAESCNQRLRKGSAVLVEGELQTRNWKSEDGSQRSVLEVKEQAYVMAARATGGRDIRLLIKHVLPNAMPPIFVVVAVDLAVVIMIEATLSFLGVGVPLTEPSLGMMIAIGKDYVYAGMWWMVVFPGAALVLLVVGINLFADWLREKLNPKIERGG